MRTGVQVVLEDPLVESGTLIDVEVAQGLPKPKVSCRRHRASRASPVPIIKRQAQRSSGNQEGSTKIIRQGHADPAKDTPHGDRALLARGTRLVGLARPLLPAEYTWTLEVTWHVKTVLSPRYPTALLSTQRVFSPQLCLTGHAKRRQEPRVAQNDHVEARQIQLKGTTVLSCHALEIARRVSPIRQSMSQPRERPTWSWRQKDISALASCRRAPAGDPRQGPASACRYPAAPVGDQGIPRMTPWHQRGYSLRPTPWHPTCTPLPGSAERPKRPSSEHQGKARPGHGHGNAKQARVWHCRLGGVWSAPLCQSRGQKGKGWRALRVWRTD